MLVIWFIFHYNYAKWVQSAISLCFLFAYYLWLMSSCMFSYAYWPLVYLLCCNVYLDLLPIFKSF
jgi:hypothetical protein